MRPHVHHVWCSASPGTVRRQGQTHNGFVCKAVPVTMQSNTTTCHLKEERGKWGGRQQRDWDKVTTGDGGRNEWMNEWTNIHDAAKDRRGRGERVFAGGWSGVISLFTNVFISSLFTLMWLTVVSCSTAISSSSSSSSSKGFEPAGAVLVGTVRLTTWDTLKDGLLTWTHVKTHFWHTWPEDKVMLWFTLYYYYRHPQWCSRCIKMLISQLFKFFNVTANTMPCKVYALCSFIC